MAPDLTELGFAVWRRERLLQALDRLTDGERRIVLWRRGLADEPTKTLDEIGKDMGITRERVRQIENNSLRKLRQLPELQAIRDPEAEILPE